MSISRPKLEPLAADVRFADDRVIFVLSDSREISVPLSLFPRLEKATPQQRRNWEWIGPGIGVHWPDVDEDISVENLLTPDEILWYRE